MESAPPVLVIHGVATRDREEFEGDVAALARAAGTGHRFIPVFWGDLGAHTEAVDAVLPYESWRSDGRDRFAELIQEPAEEPVLAALQRAAKDKDPDLLLRAVAEGWKRYSTASRRAMIGAMYGLFRDRYLFASAEFIGDLLVYERRRAEIQAHVWQVIMREAPGYGLPERPISAIAHSLGGVILFDMAVAGQPALHLDHFVTCGSQPSFFHVIGGTPPPLAPYRKGHPTTLPTTIGDWTNFFVPLDLWAFIAAPVFRLHSGGRPEDIEVHAERRADRLFKHAARYYWTHPVVAEGLRKALGALAEGPAG